MESKFIEQYAQLLTDYCCNVSAGDRVLIRSTYLAEPLIVACQKAILIAGGTCEYDISLPNMRKQFYDFSSDDQLSLPPLLYEHAIKSFDVIMSIHAPYDIYECQNVSEQKLALAQSAIQPIKNTMMKRGSNGKLRWVICNYPTKSLAKAAKMSLNSYTKFIVQACFLHKKSPKKGWENLSIDQAYWVNILNQGTTIQFKSDDTDIQFNIKNRRWINSDGKRNMPSGEVFTSPMEASGEGVITFDIPSLLFGKVINGLTLCIKKGKVVSWKSRSGKKLLDRLFTIKGANRVGEIAIGTNTQIQTHTLNTLFDEKIGGTIHMAIGASYPETGGKNKSSIHHDFISTFNTNTSIILDGKTIYKNGKFVV